MVLGLGLGGGVGRSSPRWTLRNFTEGSGVGRIYFDGEELAPQIGFRYCPAPSLSPLLCPRPPVYGPPSPHIIDPPIGILHTPVIE